MGQKLASCLCSVLFTARVIQKDHAGIVYYVDKGKNFLFFPINSVQQDLELQVQMTEASFGTLMMMKQSQSQWLERRAIKRKQYVNRKQKVQKVASLIIKIWWVGKHHQLMIITTEMGFCNSFSVEQRQCVLFMRNWRKRCSSSWMKKKIKHPPLLFQIFHQCKKSSQQPLSLQSLEGTQQHQQISMQLPMIQPPLQNNLFQSYQMMQPTALVHSSLQLPASCVHLSQQQQQSLLQTHH